jgi:hypothetical protein
LNIPFLRHLTCSSIVFWLPITGFFYKLGNNILPTGSRKIPIGLFYFFFAGIKQMPQKTSLQSALSPILEPYKKNFNQFAGNNNN